MKLMGAETRVAAANPVKMENVRPAQGAVSAFLAAMSSATAGRTVRPAHAALSRPDASLTWTCFAGAGPSVSSNAQRPAIVG